MTRNGHRLAIATIPIFPRFKRAAIMDGGRGRGVDSDGMGFVHSEGEEAAAAEEGATAGSGASADGRVGSAPRNLLARRRGGTWCVHGARRAIPCADQLARWLSAGVDKIPTFLAIKHEHALQKTANMWAQNHPTAMCHHLRRARLGMREINGAARIWSWRS